MLNSLAVGSRDFSFPTRLKGWGRKKQHNVNAKIKVVAAHTLTIPPEHERDSCCGNCNPNSFWTEGKALDFCASEPNVWRGYEVASSITLADNPEFKVLTKNLTHDKEACIEAGIILGHFEVLNADHDEVQALQASHSPADAANLATHDAMAMAMTLTQHALNQVNANHMLK